MNTTNICERIETTEIGRLTNFVIRDVIAPVNLCCFIPMMGMFLYFVCVWSYERLINS